MAYDTHQKEEEKGCHSRIETEEQELQYTKSVTIYLTCGHVYESEDRIQAYNIRFVNRLRFLSRSLLPLQCGKSVAA